MIIDANVVLIIVSGVVVGIVASFSGLGGGFPYGAIASFPGVLCSEKRFGTLNSCHCDNICLCPCRTLINQSYHQ